VKTLAEVRTEFRKATRNDVDRAILCAWSAASEYTKSMLLRERLPLGLEGCGDNSCLIAEPSGGVRTNGGCRCEGHALRLAVMAYKAEVERLTALLALESSK